MTASTNAQILAEVKSLDTATPSLTDRVDRLEENQAGIITAVADNTTITKRIDESTIDLVTGIDWLKKFTRGVIWIGGFAAALGAIFSAIYYYNQAFGGSGL